MASKKEVELRKKLKQQLLNRTKESYDKKDSFGMYGSYISDESNRPMWKCKDGNHIIDIIPFQVGPHHPELDEGDIAYCLDIWVHRGIGPTEQAYLCLARNFQKECPICEYQAKLKAEEDYDEKMVKALYPKRRVVYNVWVQDSAEEKKKGVQIFEVAHFFLERTISELAWDPRTGGFIAFSDPDEGKSISFKRSSAGDRTEFLAHRLVDRDYKVPMDMVMEAFQLDTIVHIPTADELAKAIGGEKVVTTFDESQANRDAASTKKDDAKEDASADTSKDDVKDSAGGDDPESPPTDDDEKCPHGGKFGVTTDELDQCEDCGIWDKCVEASEGK